MRTIALTMGAALAMAAQTPPAAKPVDLCSPPPGLAAPTLPAHLMEGQGDIHFPITTSNPEAQKFFDQGVAQMHSFWAREAERSFLQAAALDPTAPMPYWGIAMVAAGDYRPRFQLDFYDKTFGASKPQENRATKAAKKAVELSQVPGKATEKEKLYIAAVAARRDLANKDSEEAYTTGLRAIAAQYPREVEARSYLALHLMRGFSRPDRQPKATSQEAVQILRELLKEAPEHAGVHHYVIHGFEGSTFAEEAWPSCRRYPELVTNIPHALHMPGHIWAQTGKWDEAVKSFSAAADNERSYIAQDQLYGTSHHGHNVHFLATSYSFQNEREKAEEAARHLMSFKENPREAAAFDGVSSAYRQGWFALLRTLVQHEQWDRLLDDQTLPVIDKPRQQAWRHWARALAYTHRKNLDQARSEARQMGEALQQLRMKTKRAEPEDLAVARRELAGHLALAEGKVDNGLRKLAVASQAERRLAYSEPPFYPRPVAESWGQEALRNGRPSVAEKAFRVALEQYPGDARAKGGLQQARRELNVPVDAGY